MTLHPYNYFQLRNLFGFCVFWGGWSVPHSYNTGNTARNMAQEHVKVEFPSKSHQWSLWDLNPDLLENFGTAINKATAAPLSMSQWVRWPFLELLYCKWINVKSFNNYQTFWFTITSDEQSSCFKSRSGLIKWNITLKKLVSSSIKHGQ